MGGLSPSELACEERSRLSGSTLANVLKPTGVGVAKPIRCFLSNDLLPRYRSQGVLSFDTSVRQKGEICVNKRKWRRYGANFDHIFKEASP